MRTYLMLNLIKDWRYKNIKKAHEQLKADVLLMCKKLELKDDADLPITKESHLNRFLSVLKSKK